MKKELNLFFTALVSYTRLPSPIKLNWSEKIMTDSFRYFPLVGIVTGIAGSIIYLFLSYWFNLQIAVIGTLAGLALITGCMHEDGLADFFDGFGGGYNKERILAIMKDSHIGVYGVIALILLFLMKGMIFMSVDMHVFPLLLISAAALSRVPPLFLINTSNYARSESSKGDYTRNRISPESVAFAVLTGVLPLLFFSWVFSVLSMLVLIIFFLLYRSYLHKKIDGFTGDTLGALQQFSEIIIFLSYLMSLKLWGV